MNILTHMREALSNLLSSKLRSFLAILGILVGTGSVVALITSSQLATAHALAQFKTLGTNLLAVDIQSMQNNQPSDQQKQLTMDDMPILMQHVPGIERTGPYISLYQNIYYGDTKFNGQILGADTDLAKIAKIYLQKGRFVSSLDKSSFYCVIGAGLADKIKGLGVKHIIGNQIRLGQWFFTIVGITKPWKPNLFMYADLNNGVVIPIKTAYLLGKYAKIQNMLIRLKPTANLMKTQDQIANEIKILLPKQKPYFRNPEKIIGIMSKQQRTFTWLLASIGGISLLVGGIGVMNIMLVSVVERRREIGIRLAIGAKRRDILRMFLIESIILTLFGGILGIIVGLLISYILSLVSGWEFQVFLLPPLLGFVVSVLVGVLSGFYPALRASRLDPIETLRSE